MASAFYEEKRQSKEAVALWTVKVSFPEFKTIEAKDFFWSTSPIEVDDEDYSHSLIEIPKGRHQRDRGNDTVQFNVANPNNALHHEFYPYEDLIERAKVTVKECYEIEPGYFESEKRFVGYLKEYSVDESSKSLNFSAISDLSRSGFNTGGRILTRERCGADFNYNGLIAPEFHPCGWQTRQGGNPIYCSKYLKGVDGCISHNNSHRFYAIKGLSDAKVKIISDSTNQSGFDYNSGSTCFIGSTLVLMADWSLKRIDEINIGDYVLGFDVFTDTLKPTKVLFVHKHQTDQYEKGLLSRNLMQREFGITREHLFFQGSQIFKPFIATIGERVKGILPTKARCDIEVLDSETVFGLIDTYNLYTDCGTYHIADQDKIIISKVHNLKPSTTVS